jgi:hypothetical protein
MYCICKFSGSWSLYDAKSMTSRPLTAPEIECTQALFSDLLNESGTILAGLQVDMNPREKLKRFPMFISRYPDKWYIYQAKTKSTHQLADKQIRDIMGLLPRLCEQNDEPLIVLQISNLAPAKILQLPMADVERLPEDDSPKPTSRVEART